jgi:subtilisin family serine protease
MGPANRGAGVMVIVWDFLPEENAEVPKDLSVNRKGGPLYIYRNQSTAVDPHGIFVASLVGGLTSGLVTDSTLVLVGVNDVLSDLALIKKLVEDYPGPVVVNFSAAMEFPIGGKESSLQRAQLQCALYDAAVNEIKEKKNCVIFVCAAGNENLDLCAATGAVSLRPDCTDCICWPQSRFGSDTPGPFIQVGATEVNPSGARKKAVYSNFGRCIDVFSHGGNICGFNTPTASYVALQGTSFASPTVSAILAAIASTDTLKITAANAIKTLQSAQQDLVSGVATTTTRAFAFVPDTVIFDSGDGKVPDYTFPREDTIVQTLNDDTDKESDDQTFKIVAVVLLVLCIFILLPFLVNKK